MGSWYSKWSSWSDCLGTGTGIGIGIGNIDKPEPDLSFERKTGILEQKIATLEQRIQIVDEANQRLYNIWNTTDERFQQQQGDIRLLMNRTRSLEQRLESISFDHCEDLIIVES